MALWHVQVAAFASFWATLHMKNILHIQRRCLGVALTLVGCTGDDIFRIVLHLLCGVGAHVSKFYIAYFVHSGEKPTYGQSHG